MDKDKVYVTLKSGKSVVIIGNDNKETREIFAGLMKGMEEDKIFYSQHVIILCSEITLVDYCYGIK